MFKLTESIIKDNAEVLSPAIYNKIKTTLKGLLVGDDKVGVKGLYYISKITALIEIEALKETPATKQVQTYEDLIT